MSPRPLPTLENSLREMFPEEWLRQTAKETGLIVRERKIDPVIIFWVLTLSFGVRLQHTLASLKREYETESRKTISDSSWYYRFTPELVEFLHQCVIHGIEELAKDPGRKLSKKLENFRDVFIQDSTIVRLHSSLADKFPAARARTVAAGIKVGVMVSAVANGPKTVALYSEKTAETKTLKIGPWIKDHILLVDLGFYKTQIKDIANLYGARWDIELLFKELKSKYALDVLETKNVQVIEALIWTAILTLIVSRRIYSLVRNSITQPEKMARYTQLRWSTIFTENASDLLTVILHICGIQRIFETIMSVFESQALDPHVKDRK